MPGLFSGSGDTVVDKRPAFMELTFYEGRPTTRERKKIQYTVVKRGKCSGGKSKQEKEKGVLEQVGRSTEILNSMARESEL